ncbi:hypothetical protein GCM10010466_29560 [Planomonospora alba]|uniref:YspA cpYpsA-related SLOG domain-containing protein n=1 Tax=Planomonospora alba TaxID=161354 RepID=A0ABP6N545_9ACTN
MRVIVTGSRDWSDLHQVCRALETVYKLAEQRETLPLTVVHGGCPTGADAMAAAWAYLAAQDLDLAVIEQVYEADWSRGKVAGPERNARMVRDGAHLVLAFHQDNSKGTADTIRRAEAAGIPCHVYTASTARESVTSDGKR